MLKAGLATFCNSGKPLLRRNPEPIRLIGAFRRPPIDQRNESYDGDHQ